MESIDRYTYDSTPDRPQTILLIDHTTGQVLWTMPVPIGQKLAIQFRKGENKSDPARPDVMHWELMPMEGDYNEVLDNALPVPPSYIRMLKVELRSEAGTPSSAG